MLNDFYRHWSEANKSGTKLKWEMQTTWEIKLRLIRWDKNSEKYNK